MPTKFKLESAIGLFKTGQKLTTIDLAVALGSSVATAKNFIKTMREEGLLVVYGFEPLPQIGKGGRPAGIYKWRDSPGETDKPFATQGLNTKERLALAHKRKLERLSKIRQDAIDKAKTADQLRLAQDDYEQALADLASETAERLLRTAWPHQYP